MWALELIAFSHRSAALRATDGNRVSRFSRAQRAPSFHACLGSATPQCLRRTRVLAHGAVLPSGSPDTVGASDFGYFGAHRFGIPSLHVPLAHASSASFPPPLHGSGSGWIATPFLHDSFIHDFTPVYPDVIQAKPPVQQIGVNKQPGEN